MLESSFKHLQQHLVPQRGLDHAHHPRQSTFVHRTQLVQQDTRLFALCNEPASNGGIAPLSRDVLPSLGVFGLAGSPGLLTI